MFNLNINVSSKFLFVIVLLLCVHKSLLEFSLPLTSLSNISPQNGYISAMQSFSENKCYKSLTAEQSKSESSCNLIIFPLDYEYLTNDLHVTPIEENLHFLFQDTLVMKFMKKIYEDPFSSILVYTSKRDTYIENLSIDKDDILTDLGKKIYDNGNNKNFIFECGDYMALRYDIGAMLTYGIRINFRNKNDKVRYESNLNQAKFGKFTLIFPEIKKFLSSKKIYDAKIELYVCQIGGTVKNYNIKNAMENNQFLLSNCTIDNIEECEMYVKELYDYIDNIFGTQKKDDNILIPMERFTPFSISKETNLILDEEYKRDLISLSASSRKNLQYRMIMIDYLLVMFKQILTFYPIYIKELPSLNERLLSYYNLLIENNSISSCYRNVKEISLCSDNLLNRLIDYHSLYQEITTFVNEFNYEKVITLSLTKHFCLPKNIDWDNSSYIYIKLLRNEYYITSNFGLTCNKESEMIFVCTDGIMTITIEIQMLLHESERLVKCTNDYFGFHIEHFVSTYMEEEPNDYYINLNYI